MKIKWTFLFLLAFALLFTLVNGKPATTAQADRTPNHLTTPQLIEAARTRGDLSPVYANLMRADAFVAPDKLPANLQGSLPWDGRLPPLARRTGVRPASVTAGAR